MRNRNAETFTRRSILCRLFAHYYRHRRDKPNLFEHIRRTATFDICKILPVTGAADNTNNGRYLM